jgi:FKBP-type peptidyl-prolyl cis-trans isomerase (trigger factor)
LFLEDAKLIRLTNKLRSKKVLNRKKRRKIIQNEYNILIRKAEKEKNICSSTNIVQRKENLYKDISYHFSNQWNLLDEYNLHSNQSAQPLEASFTENIASNLRSETIHMVCSCFSM